MGKEAKEKKARGKKKYDFVYWKYDGGQIGSFLTEEYDPIMPSLDCKRTDFFKKEMKPNKHNKILMEELAQSKKIKIRDCVQLKLPIDGTSYLSKGKKKTKLDIDECYKEFAKMFSPEKGPKAQVFIVKLLAVVLSSYFIRNALRQKDVLNMYPLLNASAALCAAIRNCGSDDAIYALRILCHSLMVSTTKKENGEFKIKAPTVLPVKGKQKLLNNAWIRPRKIETDFKWPAPYRDTAVMLDGRFFQKSDINNFLFINPWCTAVIYAKKLEHTRLCVELDGKNMLEQLKVDWNIDAVNKLIAEYIPFINNTFDKRSHANDSQDRSYADIWGEAGEYLTNYMITKKGEEIGYAERFKQRILLSALLSFVDFISSSCNISPDDVQNLKRELLTALLPGCCPSKSEEEVQVIHFPAFDEILRELISPENMNHFYPITKKGQVHPTQQPDGTEIWGYVRKYRDEESNKKKINIAFFRDVLIKIVEEKYPQCGNFGEVLAVIRKRNPAYLHKTPNIKCRTVKGEEQRTILACRLILDELPISDEVKQAFRQMLPKNDK